MKFFSLFTFLILWICVSSATSTNDNTTSPPLCVIPCFVDVVVGEGKCDLNRVAPCLCPNTQLQRQLSICVRKSCNLEDQGLAVAEQAILCAGYPQESRTSYILKMGISFFVIALLILSLRLFTRYSITGKLWADDWAALVAGICLTIVASLQIYACSLGFGRHIWQIPVAKGLELIKPFYALQFMYIAVQVLAKISLLLVYRRIYPSPKFHLICNIGIALIAIHGVAFTITILFQCSPIKASWDPTVHGQCLSAPAIGFAGAGFSILEDLVIIIMPLPQLIHLQIKMAQKIALVFMFSIGSFACITSIVRLKFLSTFENSADLTWENTDILVWSVLEIEVTMICACLPTLRPFFIDYVPGVYRALVNGNDNSRTSNSQIYTNSVSTKGKRQGRFRLCWRKWKEPHSTGPTSSPACEKPWSPGLP